MNVQWFKINLCNSDGKYWVRVMELKKYQYASILNHNVLSINKLKIKLVNDLIVRVTGILRMYGPLRNCVLHTIPISLIKG